ncbi:MAG: hypothetical protein ABSF09_12255 [Candidatus Bathyarchaeia archaeon]|jgi:hypothetical protein
MTLSYDVVWWLFLGTVFVAKFCHSQADIPTVDNKPTPLGEFEETSGELCGFEIHDGQIFVTLTDSWRVLVQNSTRTLQLLQTLKKGDRISIFRGDDDRTFIRVKRP